MAAVLAYLNILLLSIPLSFWPTAKLKVEISGLPTFFLLAAMIEVHGVC